ncbi:MAG: replication initiation protein [Treponema sp.]|nr:replication initiation protein [Treponema sp.]
MGQLKIRPKVQAVKDAYIQPNPITRAYWMVFDIDREQSRYWPDEWHVPAPNMEARNPENNHQHVFYMIDPAVYTLRQARRKPLELAADVDKGLTRVLNADPGYGKLISKNPLSARWTVYVWHEKAWGLTELLDYIPDKIKSWKPNPKEVIGLGRNCTVFDQARVYAYAEWKRLRFDDQDRLLEAVYNFSMNINLSFKIPMIDKEVLCIARSISKWTARHMTAEGLREWHREQGRKSGKVRQIKADSKTKMIMDFIADHVGLSNRKVAAALGMPESTIRLHLKKAAETDAQRTISGL